MEAEVYIDGVRLTDAQVMTLRVAVGSFTADEDHLKTLGPIGTAYAHHASTVERMLVDGASRPDRMSARRLDR